jgi:phosphoribosylformylglycinamidine (FGAM) synthase PurS component
LAARDPWSFTVFDALKRKLGFAALAGVERLKSWQLHFDLHSEEEAMAVTGKILRETALLANPNRDIWMMRGPSHLDFPERFFGRYAVRDRSFLVRVTDSEPVVGRAVRAVLAGRLGLPQVTSVVFSLIWLLEFEEPDEGLHALAAEIAVAKEWRRGLLANPHCQSASVMTIEDYLSLEGGGP